ncbi:MAG TPA: peptide chain release factor N(5)-glutamine methyltransferase [Planctomycetota bacterium]|nr:peptide chain release factor N(5)-glutamine methyltransferase [Planctomycetota bacterium]
MTDARRRATRAALEGARAALAAAGLDDPLREAETLLAAALGIERSALHADPPALDPSARARFEGWVARRVRREPAAYILGVREFRSREFRVGPAVLVPRPETEVLVEAALEALPAREAAEAVDAGTGSGCIAITLAAERPRLRVVATDRSAAALAVAAENARALGVADRVRFQRGDFLEGVVGPVDLVVSNPPYVAEGEDVDPEVLHEPREALYAGADGLDAYRAIAPVAARVLKPGGLLLLETPGERVDAIAAILRAAGLEPGAPIPDLAGRPRVLPATAGTPPSGRRPRAARSR